MNKELAINLLRGSVLGTNEQLHEAVFMAIRALKSEPIMYDTGSWQTTVTNLPPVEYAPVKHGTWRHYEGTLTCSVCHTEIYDDIMELLGDDVPRYCPNCGAKMDEVEE